LAAEKLRERHGVDLAVETVRSLLAFYSDKASV
jgi:hypothetical protein